MAARVPQSGQQGLLFGSSCQLSLNRYSDSITPAMRKLDDGGRKREKQKRMPEIVATNVIASQLPKHRTERNTDHLCQKDKAKPCI